MCSAGDGPLPNRGLFAKKRLHHLVLVRTKFCARYANMRTGDSQTSRTCCRLLAKKFQKRTKIPGKTTDKLKYGPHTVELSCCERDIEYLVFQNFVRHINK